MALSLKTAPHWEPIGRRPHHGIALPLFSLHTEKGPATYLDLIPLIDWCKKVGFDCIQLLPLNDTGLNPSPYSPLSASALHPRYLAPSPLTSSESYSWLKPYALFKTLKQKFSQKSFKEWPEEYQSFHPKHLDLFSTSAIEEEQHRCFSQMEKVKAYASSQNIFLIGDIPILISPDSADVWAHPELFDLTHKAGAPPDMYNEKGQIWGFPLFRWDEMEKQKNLWWKERLKTAEKLFHIYRIDHVVGFFRIWAIPEQGEPSFFPRDPSLWEPQGRKILEMFIDSTSMLPVAEDLGTIPEAVYHVLKTLGICGTKVMRWQPNIPLPSYEPFSITTLSNHDTESLESWWKNTPQESVPFAHLLQIPYHPILNTHERFQILKASHSTPSYFHINPLQEYLSLIPAFQHPNPDTDRINWPGTLNSANWNYRFKPTLEEMISNQELKERLRSLLSR